MFVPNTPGLRGQGWQEGAAWATRASKQHKKRPSETIRVSYLLFLPKYYGSKKPPTTTGPRGAMGALPGRCRWGRSGHGGARGTPAGRSAALGPGLRGRVPCSVQGKGPKAQGSKRERPVAPAPCAAFRARPGTRKVWGAGTRARKVSRLLQRQPGPRRALASARLTMRPRPAEAIPLGVHTRGP